MYRREEAFRVYMSDTMYIAYKLNMHYVDLLKPIIKVKPENIVMNIMTKGGLKFKDERI